MNWITKILRKKGIKQCAISGVSAYCMVSEFVFTNYALYKLLAVVRIINKKK